MWGVNRWLSTRFNLLSSALLGLTGFVAVLSPSISAALAGFALTFASSITHNVGSLGMYWLDLADIGFLVAALGSAVRWSRAIYGVSCECADHDW